MFILASSSPRRMELIKKITNDFIIVKPNIDERRYQFPIKDYPLELSKLKAYEVRKRYPNSSILACDTVVIYNNEIINKPKNKDDAIHILKMLSGQKHIVLSGYTYLDRKHEINRSVKTIVYFNKLTDELINEYVNKGLAFGKAGAYGIQDNYPLVKKIVGSYDNVMGFPSEDIIAHLKQFV